MCATFTNAADVAAIAGFGNYSNYVAQTVANDVSGWWYAFSVTVSNLDATGHAFIRITEATGTTNAPPLAMVADTPGTYTFLLKQGVPYTVHVDPDGGSACAANESSAIIVPPTWAADGSVVVPPGGIEVSPRTFHSYHASDFATFSAVCYHAHPSLGTWHWSCADENVAISTPDATCLRLERGRLVRPRT